jgi:MFS family permease
MEPPRDCITLADQRVCREIYPQPGVRRRAFWVLAAVFVLGMAGGTLPSPLYPLYQKAFGFSNAVVTVIFAFYGAGVLASLLGLGRASDQWGRKTMLFVALGLAAVSTFSFLFAQEMVLLFVGRFFSGLAIGVLTGTATAALTELEPRGSRRRASVVSGMATPGGLGLGAVLTGGAVESGTLPLRLIFLIYLGLLAVLAVCVLLLPETVPVEARARAFRFQRLHVPKGMWAGFVVAAAGVFTTFAMMSLFASLLPSFLVQTLGRTDHLLSGAAVGLVFLAAVAAPPLIGRGSIGRAGLYGLVAIVVGLVLVVTGLAATMIVLLVIGCAIAGFGGGCLFVGSLAFVNKDAPPDRRAEVVSAYFVAGYVGVTLPPIAVGFGSVHIGIIPSVLAMSAVIVGLAAFAAAGLQRLAG